MADRVFFDVDQAVAGLLSALDRELTEAATDAAKLVAEEAASNHPYQNRTGRLQQRTVAGRTTGVASNGNLRFRVLGDTRYGSFVNDGTKNEDGSQRTRPYPFLAPAYERRMSGVAATFEVAMTRAAKSEGWSE